MRRPGSGLVGLALLIAETVGVLLLTIDVPVSVAAAAAPDTAHKAWAQFIRAHGPAWRAQWDPTLGVATEVKGGRYSVIAGDPEQVAKTFLSENRNLFGIESDLSDLSVGNIKHSPAGTHVFLKQTYQGLPVFNGGVDVHISAGNQVMLVHNRYAPGEAVSRISLTPAVSPADAAAVAESDARSHPLTDKSGKPLSINPKSGPPELGIWRASDAYHLAYQIQAGPMGYIIDAQSGAILSHAQMIDFVDGTGTVFDPNPVVTLNNANLGDRNNKNYKALKNAYKTVTLPKITETDKGKKKSFTLVGPNVSLQEITINAACSAGNTDVALPPPVAKNKPNFKFTRNKSGFDDTMAYFHIDRNQSYIQNSLGFFDVNDRAIPVDADAITADNSFYCPSPKGSGFLAFGIGGVNDAQDADVILHEYGHSIQDNENQATFSGAGKTEETGAMGEGFGDYWAISNLHSNNACFSAWDHNIVDFPADNGCLRRVDGKKHYPEALDNEVHDDGEIWSAALYDLFNTLGKGTVDPLVLESHFFLPAPAMMKDGGAELLFADLVLNNSANHDTICAELAFRGIFSPQDLVDNDCFQTLPDGVLGDFGKKDIFTATCHGTFIAANIIGDFGDDLQLTIDGTQNLAGSVVAKSEDGTFKKLEVMRNPNTNVGTPADLGATLTVQANSPPTPPTPPYTQCPAVGADTSCQVLITIDAGGNLSVAFDNGQGPYDQIEDVLVGVQNNSPNAVSQISVGGSGAFGFDGDGICGTDPNTGLPFNPVPPGCPFGPTTYEGPGVTFSDIDPSFNSAAVNFSPPIPANGSAYFSLEGLASPPSPPLFYTAKTTCDGTNLNINQTGDDQ